MATITRNKKILQVLIMGRKKRNNVVLYMRVPIELKDELKKLVKNAITEKIKKL